MNNIDKNFRNQQEIFAWLGVEGNKVRNKITGNIVSFINGGLFSQASDNPSSLKFSLVNDWEKVLPPCWGYYLEEYDILCYRSDIKGFLEKRSTPAVLVKGKCSPDYKASDNIPWRFAEPLNINDFEILEGKWLGKKKEKQCSTE